jgi:hypothetical protein
MKSALIIIAIVFVLDSELVNRLVLGFTGTPLREWAEIHGRKFRAWLL